MVDEVPRWIAKIQSTLRFSRDHKPDGGEAQRAALSVALITLFKEELRLQAVEISGIHIPDGTIDEYQQTAVEQFIYRQFLSQPKLVETAIDQLIKRCSEMDIDSLKDLLAEAYAKLKICQDRITDEEKGFIDEILNQGSPDESTHIFRIAEAVFFYMQTVFPKIKENLKSEARNRLVRKYGDQHVAKARERQKRPMK